MNTSAHVNLETLVDLAEDRTTAAREAAMLHISTCSACDDKLRRLQQLIRKMKSDTAVDPPRDVLLSAINVFARKPEASLRRIIARLIFDSRSSNPAFGMRSIHTSSRQLLYSAEDTDLDLRITVQNEECVVTGQIIRDGCAGGLVEISGATGTVETRLNELCEFTLSAIPVGTYSLRVKMLDVEIEIPELELKD